MKLRTKFVVAATALLSVVTATAASATPPGTVDYVNQELNGISVFSTGRDIVSPVTGQSVLFGAKLSAVSPVTVTNLFFACRTPTNVLCDFGHQSVTIGTTPLTFEKPKTFTEVGTYQLWVQYEYPASSWHDLTPHQTFTVAAPAGDTTPPSVPTGFASEARPGPKVLITWAASTDNVGVTDYEFQQDGVTLGFTPTPDWLTGTLVAGQTYQFRARARDAAGNLSAWSVNFPYTVPGGPVGPNCRLNPGSCGYPNASNTGVPAGTTLTPSGGLNITVAGTVINAKDISGCVIVNAANVTIQNSRIRTSGCFHLIQNNSTGLVIKDTELDCLSANNNGTSFGNYSWLRVNVHDCENGGNADGNVDVRDSYVHDLETDAGAHTDGFQFNQGGSGFTFVHNTIIVPEPGSSSSITFWDEVNPQNINVLIDNNLLSGGAYILRCARQGTPTNVRILNNRFGISSFGYATDCVSPHITEWSNNVDDSNNAQLPPA